MITWGNPDRLLWLWAVLAFAVGLTWLGWHNRKLRRNLADPQILPRVVRGDWNGSEYVHGALIVLAASFLVVGLARPQWGEHLVPAPSKGADVVLVVDASLSMMAQDVAPTRLGLARRELRRLVDSLGPCRLGLVGFAGSAIRQIPLTEDRAALATLLDAMGPDLLPVAGTDFGPALATARGMLERSTAQHRIVVLVTDGGDHGKNASDEASQLAKVGAKVFVIGVGGSAPVPIPLEDGGVKMDHEGNIVTVKLERDALRELAQSAGGTYLELNPLAWNLGAVMESVHRAVSESGVPGMRLERVERFDWFLALALFLVTLELALPHGRRHP